MNTSASLSMVSILALLSVFMTSSTANLLVASSIYPVSIKANILTASSASLDPSTVNLPVALPISILQMFVGWMGLILVIMQ